VDVPVLLRTSNNVYDSSRLMQRLKISMRKGYLGAPVATRSEQSAGILHDAIPPSSQMLTKVRRNSRNNVTVTLREGSK
jgi:hypothetical protein